MRRNPGKRFWTESVLAVTGLFLTVVTLVAPDWIEAVFGIDPDGGNGAVEWMLVAAFAVAALVNGALARHEWLAATARRR